MSPFDLNQVSVIPVEEEQERDHACSSLSPDFFDQRAADYNRLVHHLQPSVLQRDQGDKFFHLVSAGSQDPDGKTQLDLTLRGAGIGGDVEEEGGGGGGREPEVRRLAAEYEWMPSKMRFVRKEMDSTSAGVGKPGGGISSEASGQIISNSGSSSPGGNGVIRVCSDCSTTKTPLWRSGPRGPKSLCNACGIRQRKARRAMAAAAAAGLGGGVVIPPSATAYKVRKGKKLDIDIDRTLPFKKRCKVKATTAITTTAAATTTTTAATSTAATSCIITAAPAKKKKACFDEELTLSSAIQKVFPQEERDAAILLMTLSCGLIRS